MGSPSFLLGGVFSVGRLVPFLFLLLLALLVYASLFAGLVILMIHGQLLKLVEGDDDDRFYHRGLLVMSDLGETGDA